MRFFSCIQNERRISLRSFTMLSLFAVTLVLTAQSDSAAKLLAAGRFEKCVAAAGAEAPKLRSDALAKLYLVQASCLKALGRDAAVSQAIDNAARAAPRLTLDSTRYPPQFVDAFVEAQKALFVTLVIEGDNATLVSIDGAAETHLPTIVRGPPGAYEMKSQNPSHSERVELGPNEQRTVTWPKASRALPLIDNVTLPEPVATRGATLPAQAIAVPQPQPQVRRTLSVPPLIVGAAGLLAAGAGTYFLIRSQERLGALRDGNESLVGQSRAQSLSYANAGETEQTVGVSLTAGGAALTVTGLVWLIADLAGQKGEPQ
jgi:hypothetical protein